jgi:hypothetical protein
MTTTPQQVPDQLQSARAFLASWANWKPDTFNDDKHYRALQTAIDHLDELIGPHSKLQASPQARPGDWRTPTSVLQRFGDAMQLLCSGRRPDDAALAEWLDKDSDGRALQEFAAEHGPAWAQGIGLIDAALTMVDQPTEGVDHEFREVTQAQPEQAAQGVGEPLQQRVQPWLMACFGLMIAGDREERNHRFLEEALELVQACGCTASEAHQLVDYTFGRPVGEKNQEVGGVMITLAALCLANDLDMHAAGEAELARIWTMVEKIREKQAAKPKHSPRPAHPAPSAAVVGRSLIGVQAITRDDTEHGVAYFRADEVIAALTTQHAQTAQGEA